MAAGAGAAVSVGGAGAAGVALYVATVTPGAVELGRDGAAPRRTPLVPGVTRLEAGAGRRLEVVWFPEDGAAAPAVLLAALLEPLTGSAPTLLTGGALVAASQAAVVTPAPPVPPTDTAAPAPAARRTTGDQVCCPSQLPGAVAGPPGGPEATPAGALRRRSRIDGSWRAVPVGGCDGAHACREGPAIDATVHFASGLARPVGATIELLDAAGQRVGWWDVDVKTGVQQWTLRLDPVAGTVLDHSPAVGYRERWQFGPLAGGHYRAALVVREGTTALARLELFSFTLHPQPASGAALPTVLAAFQPRPSVLVLCQASCVG
jgi:hypothetical protein